MLYCKELPTRETLKETIKKTISNAWNAPFLFDSIIEKWLRNFTGNALSSSVLDKKEAEKREQQIALFLLCNYVYLNEKEVRNMMKLMLSSFIHRVIVSQSSPSIDEKELLGIIKRTEFWQLGNSSESSAYMLYLFRQENELSKFDFQKKAQCDYLVFIDDFSISGNQASGYLKSFLSSHQEYIDKMIIVLLMVSTPDAISELERVREGIIVIPCILLDESAKVFSDSSIIFNGYSGDLKSDALKICEYYGNRILTKGNIKDGITALGYKDAGFLVGAFYNTPNNTLPIIWSEFNWKCIFHRYDKQYKDENYALPGGGYV